MGIGAALDGAFFFESPQQAGRYEVADGLITLTATQSEPRSTWIIIEGESSVIIGGRPVFESDND